MKKITILFFLAAQVLVVYAQQTNAVARKGKFFFYWGYNRAGFTNSDIHFTGPGYDFTLEAVQAKDRPQEFSFRGYFGITTMWQPQYIYRLGYFVSDHWSISLGLDHMKYIMSQFQTVEIKGEINQEGNPFNGVYNAGDKIWLHPRFLTYEHSDGLNYLNASADYHLTFYQIPSGKFRIDGFAGGGLGVQIPKSNVQLFNELRNDSFHLTGFGVHTNVGISFVGWDVLFIRTQAKGGFQYMPDVITRPNKAPDRASQFFWFGMWDFAIGAQWHF